MKAVVVDRPGGPSMMRIGTMPDPAVGAGDLLVKVHATALNRLDLAQREGHYPPPAGASEILGVEMAGEVVAWGSEVQGWSQGDRVCALLPGGGYAGLAAVPEGMAMRVPDSLTLQQAAAIPEVFLTAYLNLVMLGKLQAGDFVLIHSGASGVGTAAIQIARAVGAKPIVTVGSEEKSQRCLQLGALAAINYRTGPFENRVLAASGGTGMAVVLDTVGAPYWDQNLAVLAPRGRLLLVSQMGGMRKELDLNQLSRRLAQVIGTMLRPLPPVEKVGITRRFAEFALPLFASGTMSPVIDSVFPVEEVAAAHARMAANANIGKIVLDLKGLSDA